MFKYFNFQFLIVSIQSLKIFQLVVSLGLFTLLFLQYQFHQHHNLCDLLAQAGQGNRYKTKHCGETFCGKRNQG